MPGERIYLTEKFNEPLRVARSICGPMKTQDLLLFVLTKWAAGEAPGRQSTDSALVQRNCHLLERISLMLEKRESMTSRVAGIEKLIQNLVIRLDEVVALEKVR